MFIRIYFENDETINIDNSQVFQKMADDYLSCFDAKYSGYIVSERSIKMEPMWQYIIESASQAQCSYLLEYLNSKSLPGYQTYVAARQSNDEPQEWIK